MKQVQRNSRLSFAVIGEFVHLRLSSTHLRAHHNAAEKKTQCSRVCRKTILSIEFVCAWDLFAF